VELLGEIKMLAREYYELTGRPLGVTGEIAEYEVVRLLGLKLSPVRQQGYDAVRATANGDELLQIKGRCLLPGSKPGQRLGAIDVHKVFWAAIRQAPAAVAEWLGRDPYPREVEYARVAAETPHLVLSTTLAGATWPTAQIVRDLDELRTFKAQPGGAVYVVGGGSLVRSLIDAELLDELRLIVHPVAVGAGTSLFDGVAQRQDLEFVESERTAAGRVNLTYRVTASALDHVQ
jgi:dihydrofolate reductase